MNILFLPFNVASMPAITANSLSKLPGIKAVSLTHSLHKYQSQVPETVVLPRYGSKKNPFRYMWNRMTYKKKLQQWINWADVLHYAWGPAIDNGDDLEWASSQGKPLFIEWVGSDIRDPDYLKSINWYYKRSFEHGNEYAGFESKERSLAAQKLFSTYHAIPLLCPEMSLYIDHTLFPVKHSLYQRLNIRDFKPNFPSVAQKKPLIIHSPSAKIAKGSNYIIPVIEELQKEYDFDFKLLHDISREEVLSMMYDADIFIDQIICGAYGMAAMEAMSFGKPVMCYIMPEVFQAGLPEDCPIVNTNPDNLKEKLIELITNPQLRHDIGRKSRDFAETFHDADKVIQDLLKIYTGELEKHKSRNDVAKQN